MPDPQHLQKIMQLLFQPIENQAPIGSYSILDAARADVIYPKLLDSDVRKICLFHGAKAVELATVAPYLVHLKRDDSFTDWLMNHGWGKSWGIFLQSFATLDELQRHFRKFLMVYDEEGKPLYFRFYDPRVLSVFLPICDKDQLLTMFGPVICYYVEGEGEDSMTRYSLLNTKLIQNVIQLAEPTVK